MSVTTPVLVRQTYATHPAQVSQELLLLGTEHASRDAKEMQSLVNASFKEMFLCLSKNQQVYASEETLSQVNPFWCGSLCLKEARLHRVDATFVQRMDLKIVIHEKHEFHFSIGTPAINSKTFCTKHRRKYHHPGQNDCSYRFFVLSQSISRLFSLQILTVN